MTASNSFEVAHTSPHIHHINTPLWIRSRLPTGTPSIALTLILRILEYPLSLVYELCKGSKFPYPSNPAIRIDNDNPAGVYFFTHSPLIALYTSCTSATFKRKPGEGVGHDLTNQQVSRPGLSPIRVPSARRSGRGVAHGPKQCVQGSRAHQPGATRYTGPRVPSLSQAHPVGCHSVDY